MVRSMPEAVVVVAVMLQASFFSCLTVCRDLGYYKFPLLLEGRVKHDAAADAQSIRYPTVNEKKVVKKKEE